MMIVSFGSTMLKKALRLKMVILAQFIIFINSMSGSPRIKAMCRRTHARWRLIGPLKIKSIMNRFKMRQCLNKFCRDSSIFSSVVSIFFGDNGPSLELSKLVKRRLILGNHYRQRVFFDCCLDCLISLLHYNLI
jgi:hypothetical protein